MSEVTMESLPKVDALPNVSGLTFFSPNYAPNLSIALFPQSGTVTLMYGQGSPAPTSVYIQHQGGQQTPVQPGQANYSVNANDYLMINGQAASCKIQWWYN